MSVISAPINEINPKKTIQMRYLDGSLVDEAYAKAVSAAVTAYCDAEERFGLDALERFAREEASAALPA